MLIFLFVATLPPYHPDILEKNYSNNVSGPILDLIESEGELKTSIDTYISKHSKSHLMCKYVGDSAPRGCTEDEGRPLGVGLQEQASKHLKLLWSKAMVVSVEEKVPPDGISCESERRAQANHPMRCRKLKDDVKTGGYLYTRISPGDTCLLPGRRPA